MIEMKPVNKNRIVRRQANLPLLRFFNAPSATVSFKHHRELGRILFESFRMSMQRGLKNFVVYELSDEITVAFFGVKVEIVKFPVCIRIGNA